MLDFIYICGMALGLLWLVQVKLGLTEIRHHLGIKDDI